jgi:hypothetical protein
MRARALRSDPQPRERRALASWVRDASATVGQLHAPGHAVPAVEMRGGGALRDHPPAPEARLAQPEHVHPARLIGIETSWARVPGFVGIDVRHEGGRSTTLPYSIRTPDRRQWRKGARAGSSGKRPSGYHVRFRSRGARTHTSPGRLCDQPGPRVREVVLHRRVGPRGPPRPGFASVIGPSSQDESLDLAPRRRAGPRRHR